MRRLWPKSANSIEVKLRKLMLSILLMCCLIIGVTLALFTIYNIRYSGEPIRILHVQGTAGATAQIGRSTGLEEAAEARDNWTIIAQLPGEYTQAKAYEVVLEYLSGNRDIDVLYCENDDMAFGAIEAMDKLGIRYGAGGGVIVISFDSVRAALEACLDGKISLCVECNPLHGPRVARLIRQMEAGVTPPKLVYVTETCFSLENLTPAIIERRTY